MGWRIRAVHCLPIPRLQLLVWLLAVEGTYRKPGERTTSPGTLSLGSRRFVLGWLQLERRRVHAIPQASRLRAVVEDMPQVGVTAAAQHLGPPHEMAAVVLGFDVSRIDRLP